MLKIDHRLEFIADFFSPLFTFVLGRFFRSLNFLPHRSKRIGNKNFQGWIASFNCQGAALFQGAFDNLSHHSQLVNNFFAFF